MRALQSRKVWQGLGFGLVARRGRPDGPHAPLHCAERCFSSVTYPGYTLLLPVTYPRPCPPRALPRPADGALGSSMHPWLAPGRTRLSGPSHPARKALSVAWVRTQSIARYAVSIADSAFTTREAHAKWPPLPIGRGPRQPAASPNARAEVEGLLLGQSPIADARLATVRWRTLLPACNSLRSEALHCGTDAECDIRASRRHAGDGERSVSRGRGAAIAVMAGFHRGLIAEIP